MFANPKRPKRGDSQSFGLTGAFLGLLGVDVEECITCYYGPEQEQAEATVKERLEAASKPSTATDVDNVQQQVLALKKASDEATALVEICKQQNQKAA